MPSKKPKRWAERQHQKRAFLLYREGRSIEEIAEELMLPLPVIKKVVKGLRPDKRVKLEEGEAMPEEKELTYEDWMAALQSEAAGTDTPEDYADLAHEMTSGEGVRRENAERARHLRNEIRRHDYYAEKWREALLKRRGGKL